MAPSRVMKHEIAGQQQPPVRVYVKISALPPRHLGVLHWV